MFYALGHTACEFYEEKSKLIKADICHEETENEADCRYTFAQLKIVDRVLIHIVLARYNARSWSEIMPILHQVTPSSVKTIAVNIEDPEPLESLLDRLDSAYARILLQRCYAIALWEDGSISPEEQYILDKIVQKFPQLIADDRLDPNQISKLTNNQSLTP